MGGFHRSGAKEEGVRTEERDYSDYTELEARGPRVGEVVAYRVMEIGEDYTPGISQYKEAKVVEVEGDQLTLEVIAGGRRRTGGKFELEDEPVMEDSTVRLRLGELIQPRLVKPVC